MPIIINLQLHTLPVAYTRNTIISSNSNSIMTTEEKGKTISLMNNSKITKKVTINDASGGSRNEHNNINRSGSRTITNSSSSDGSDLLSCVRHHKKKDDQQRDNRQEQDHHASSLREDKIGGVARRHRHQMERGGTTGRFKRSNGSQVFLPRLIKRDMIFHQSHNKMAVQNINEKRLFKLLLKDWFHVLLRINTVVSVFILIVIWTVMLLLFALLYFWVDNSVFFGGGTDQSCGLGDEGADLTWAAAFAFAMETATTVGYGLPSSSNAFFETGCIHVQASIYFQMVFNMLFNAFMFAFFYSQLSKSETRSIQLVFSNKLVIRINDDNQVCASVRCYDLDSANPLVECHARMYLLDHKLKMKPLRITDPDDDFGGMMHPSLPQEIVHIIDHHSILSPRSMPLTIPATNRTTRVNLRSIDSATGNREEIYCPVCGDTFSSYEQLQRHVDWNAMVEEEEEYPLQGLSHRSFVMPDISPISLQEVQDHIERTLSEIVVIVEAIDPQLSGTFQAIQSYKYENIEFGADFVHCMTIKDNTIAVNIDKFHLTKQHENSFFDLQGTENLSQLLASNNNKDVNAMSGGNGDNDFEDNDDSDYLYKKYNDSDNGTIANYDGRNSIASKTSSLESPFTTHPTQLYRSLWNKLKGET